MDAVSTGVSMMITPQRQMHIDELERSIVALAKRKMKLLSEVQEINKDIEFLRNQKEDLIV